MMWPNEYKHFSLNRRLQDAEDKNRDLLTTVARREEALHQNNVRSLKSSNRLIKIAK